MNILLLGATGSIGDSVLGVIEENHSELNLFGITFYKNITFIKHVYLEAWRLHFQAILTNLVRIILIC